MRAPLPLLLGLLAALSAAAQGPGEGSHADPVVQVAQGRLRGSLVRREPGATLRSLYAFQGVPYARPPVGARRFQDPEEAEAWSGIRNATSYGSICMQKDLVSGNVSGEEDCLFLNIFTADPPETWQTVKRPVMVFIHGGAFVVWSGNADAARPDPLLRQGVVVVTLNYRLGILGFLNTEDSQAPGNAGLKDQAMALRWVQRNIAAFGGDPSRVTIMGESAGGASVHYHMLSPLSRGLFHNAISVSGSALLITTYVQQPRRGAEVMRRRYAVNCPDDAPDAIVSCLQRVDARELVFNQYEVPFEQNFFQRNAFLPAVEAPGSSRTPFLTEEPEQLLREGRFAKVPYMTGYTSAEGIIVLASGRLLTEPSRWTEVDENFGDIFSWTIPSGARTRENALRARAFFLGERSLRNATQHQDTLRRFVQFCSDIAINVATLNAARLMADGGATVYVYEFSRDGPIAFVKDLGLNASFIPGVAHGDDMPYLFDFANATSGQALPVPPAEQPLRERQAKIFANMIKTGDPTPAGSGLPRWPPFRAPQESYLDMGESLRVLPHAGGRRVAFWRQLAAEIPRKGPASKGA